MFLTKKNILNFRLFICMKEEIIVIYVPKVKCWVLQENGLTKDGRRKGVIVAVVDGMSEKEQVEYFLDKILEKDEKLEIYKAILTKLTS